MALSEKGCAPGSKASISGAEGRSVGRSSFMSSCGSVHSLRRLRKRKRKRSRKRKPGSRKERRVCPVCFKTFRSRKKLRAHMKKHTAALRKEGLSQELLRQLELLMQALNYNTSGVLNSFADRSANTSTAPPETPPGTSTPPTPPPARTKPPAKHKPPKPSKQCRPKKAPSGQTKRRKATSSCNTSSSSSSSNHSRSTATLRKDTSHHSSCPLARNDYSHCVHDSSSRSTRCSGRSKSPALSRSQSNWSSKSCQHKTRANQSSSLNRRAPRKQKEMLRGPSVLAEYIAKRKRAALSKGPVPHRYICPLCRKTFQWVDQLKRHMTTHTEEEIYRCPDCDFLTVNAREWENHLKRHSGIPYRCSVCDAEFPSARSLIRHINHVHGYPVAKQDPLVAKAKKSSRILPSQSKEKKNHE